MSNAEQFLTIFNKIEKHLKTLSRQDGYQNITSLIREVSQYNRLVRIYEDDLKEYIELRNAIVHQYKGTVIAEPHDEVVQQIKKIYENLTKPPKRSLMIYLIMVLKFSPVLLLTKCFYLVRL